MLTQALRQEAFDLVGADGVYTHPAQLRAYECDGLTGYKVTPGMVVLPTTTEQVAGVVRACNRAGVPFVARGAGTGLSGGALPSAEGILIGLARMRRILEVDVDDQRMVVEPGVTNLEITNAVAPHNLYYAPDPSSQVVCTIGGNVAENSGGAHCLKYGFTTNHVLALEVVLPDGEIVQLDAEGPDPLGYDLRGVFIGSEGTLGIATKITVRLLRTPEAVRTLVADFTRPEEAGEAVTQIVAAGIIPAAVEILDQLAIEACEKATHAGYSLDAGAALIVEVDGPKADTETTFDEIEAICRKAGSTKIRVAHDPGERMLIWKGRKAAFAAMGRISPDYFVQDGVIPRTALGEALARIGQMADQAGLQVANVFHAGDGNLHPLVLYDMSREGEAERGEELSTAIAEMCVELGGSITGEHGVGRDKACSMPKMFSEDDLAIMRRLRKAFDPEELCNPDKLFPTPRLCGEKPGPYRQHPLEEAGVAERM